MLIIGHRGAKGSCHENTLESLRLGYSSGADMLEFDVRLTKDGVPILAHDASLFRTHRRKSIISRNSLKHLKEITEGLEKPIVTLEEVLDEFFGKVLLNIEAKSSGSGKAIAKLLISKYIKKEADYDNFTISSFRARELFAVRKLSKKINLWLLHYSNPYVFVIYARLLNLQGVGFYKLNYTDLSLEIAKKSGLFVYTYTINRAGSVNDFKGRGFGGVVTDYPLKLRKISVQKQSHKGKR